MAENTEMAAPNTDDILPAYVERGHVCIVFEKESTTVEPATPSASDPVETITTPECRETDAMVQPMAAQSEVKDVHTSIATPPFHEIVTHKSPCIRNLMMINKLEDKFDEGYDSDGECGPFFNLEDVEGLQIYEEEEMMEKDKMKLEKTLMRSPMRIQTISTLKEPWTALMLPT